MFFIQFLFLLLVNLLKTDQNLCSTEIGEACEIPFQYNQRYYESCIDTNNGGVPWCYTNTEMKHWGVCKKSACPNARGKSLYLKS